MTRRDELWEEVIRPDCAVLMGLDDLEYNRHPADYYLVGWCPECSLEGIMEPICAGLLKSLVSEIREWTHPECGKTFTYNDTCKSYVISDYSLGEATYLSGICVTHTATRSGPGRISASVEVGSV